MSFFRPKRLEVVREVVKEVADTGIVAVAETTLPSKCFR